MIDKEKIDLFRRIKKEYIKAIEEVKTMELKDIFDYLNARNLLFGVCYRIKYLDGYKLIGDLFIDMGKYDLYDNHDNTPCTADSIEEIIDRLQLRVSYLGDMISYLLSKQQK